MNEDDFFYDPRTGRVAGTDNPVPPESWLRSAIDELKARGPADDDEDPPAFWEMVNEVEALHTTLSRARTESAIERISAIREILENVRIDHYGADYGCPFIEDIDEVVAAIIAAMGCTEQRNDDAKAS
jgi:hypothetical protein